MHEYSLCEGYIHLFIKASNIMIRILVLVVLFLNIGCVAQARQYPYDFLPENQSPQYMGVQIHQSLRVNLSSSFGRLTELSGIAWDHDDAVLYAVTDAGFLYHLKLNLSGTTISNVTVGASYQLKDMQGKVFSSGYADAEGLSILNANNGIRGDAELLISFEGKPRVVRFDRTGYSITSVRLPSFLEDYNNYRHPNKALESVMLHPRWGVITASELPLKERREKQQVLYAEGGQQWLFEAKSAKKSSVTGLLNLPDDNVLVLERAWAGFIAPLVISLRKVDIATCRHGTLCNVQDLAVFSSNEGWLVDNFEGLASLGGNRYLMVSDDNKSPLQSTVFILFGIL